MRRRQWRPKMQPYGIPFNGHRQDEAIVVIGVFADDIDAARGAGNGWLGVEAGTEGLGEPGGGIGCGGRMEGEGHQELVCRKRRKKRIGGGTAEGFIGKRLRSGRICGEAEGLCRAAN